MANETSAKLILLEPFYISRDTYESNHRAKVLKELVAYRETVAELAQDSGAEHVRLHDKFEEILRSHPADSLRPEPVHPKPSGHLVMAHEWLTAVGF